MTTQHDGPSAAEMPPAVEPRRVDTSDRPFGLPADGPTTIQFTVPGEAVPWARSGGGKTVFRFTPAKQRNYMAVLKDYGSRAMGSHNPLESALELTVVATYAIPKSWSKRRVAEGPRWKTSRPDADNISKIIKDALNTVAWRDDAQVCRLIVEKRYGERPCVQVTIRELARAA